MECFKYSTTVFKNCYVFLTVNKKIYFVLPFKLLKITFLKNMQIGPKMSKQSNSQLEKTKVL